TAASCSNDAITRAHPVVAATLSPALYAGTREVAQRHAHACYRPGRPAPTGPESIQYMSQNSIYPDLGYPITLFCVSGSPSARVSRRSLSFRAVAEQRLAPSPCYTARGRKISLARAATSLGITVLEVIREYPVGRAPDTGR